MANVVKSKYVMFYTTEFWKARNNEDYNDAKFEQMYSTSAGRMTPEQIKAHGYDIARSRMYSQYLDKKYDSLYQNEVAMANCVAHQIEDAINELYPDLKVKVAEGEVHKYGSNKLRFPKVYVGKENEIVITPNLEDKDDNYLSVTITIDDADYDNSFYMNDIQLMEHIGMFAEYTKTKVLPKFGVNKVYNRCENQYVVSCGKCKVSLYDTEMVNLYHTLSKVINAQYGTKFPYSEETIKRLYKHPTFGNIQYTGKFYLDYIHGDRADLKYSYFYEDDKTKEPTFGCVTTYGTWEKEELINLLEVLKPYVMGDYFYEMSKKTLGEKYGDYDRMGIGYSKKPDYFDVLLWEC